ncbi:MAG: TPM domain-containing protein [Clostridia bacterium]|nr:TPM domain-containing protein [Clostridia bacterium]
MVERIAGDKHGGSGIVTDEHMSDEEQITGKANKTTDDSVPTTDSSISGYVSGSDSATNTVTKYADIATGTQKITGSVVDMADLLTGAEESYLTKRIEYIRDRYDFDIVIVTTPSANGKDIVSYCDDLYDYNGYGVGENRDGLLFCINLNDGAGAGNRDYYTSTRGFGITAFTDYAIADNDAVINSAVLPYLVDGDWHGAFDKYLDLADEFLNEAKNGIAYDVWHRYSP